ncbi:MAG: hypothetical protein ACTSV1_05200, partial [Alphaproteobacteria bacterium]
MPKPTIPAAVPPPPFNKWVIIATAISFIAMIGMFFLQADPEDIAPDGPLGQTADPVETNEPLEPEPKPGTGPRSEAPAAPYTGAGSLAGRYLAGRHAQAIREMGDAAMFLGKAQELSPGTTGLPRRIFLLTLSEGNMSEAVPLAGDVLKENPKAPIAGLVAIVDDFFQARFEPAREKIATLPTGGLNVYMTPLLDAWTAMALGEKTIDAIARLKPLQKNGTTALYKLHSAIINDVAGNTEEAEQDYLAAIEAQGGPSLR